MLPDLFDDAPRDLMLEPGAVVLGGFAAGHDAALMDAIGVILDAAPLRHLVTPGGWRMSVAMSNCGRVGWVSDRRGYRYDPVDPESSRAWPAMPGLFKTIAARAAEAAGFPAFVPDACLINRYEPGARLSLHQDRDEEDREAPIVSISLGLPATFLWGGQKRGDRPRRIRLTHGDAVVWGGPARFAFHGVDPVADGIHSLTGRARFNLTFRKVFRS
ncbi:alpha-ketoglutarate-dependent dioxygenase AlkB [Sphingomonas sp. DBB INV C78]|uniref:DNA oxidative demethylase AlkB n=1 Tax=Sphingomonas sp. DBB INV C78 TaxID=3349434 RepID=UPI0036D3265E